MQAPMRTDDDMKAIVQGPGDVEWRYDVACPPPSGSPWLRDRIDRYEMRRECQEILPGLLLGPFQVSKSLEKLQALGVTHMYVAHWSVKP